MSAGQASGTLYLVPAPLDFGCASQSPLQTSMPDGTLKVAASLQHWVCENAKSTRALLGRGKTALIDTRPAERNGDHPPASALRLDPRRITWTHYYGLEDTYSRIDYILLSSGMAREWQPDETYVLALPDWGVASDHRPLVAAFSTTDR